MKVRLMKTKAKEIFTKTKLPGCDLVINQYVGCQHACLYCYAKFISRWRPTNYGRWGSWVEAKMNAPELIKKKSPKGLVYMSSISDPYQPIEKELKLTHKILENLDKKTNLTIQTKSNLVLRDLDLFKKFKNIEIGLTINGFKGKNSNIFEPFSSSNKERIRTLQDLKKKQIRTFAFISPIIPGLIDLQEVINNTKSFADSYWFEFINVRGAGREFMQTIEKEFPRSYNILRCKTKFAQFIEISKKIINSQNIKIQGIEIH